MGKTCTLGNAGGAGLHGAQAGRATMVQSPHGIVTQQACTTPVLFVHCLLRRVQLEVRQQRTMARYGATGGPSGGGGGAGGGAGGGGRARGRPQLNTRFLEEDDGLAPEGESSSPSVVSSHRGVQRSASVTGDERRAASCSPRRMTGWRRMVSRCYGT